MNELASDQYPHDIAKYRPSWFNSRFSMPSELRLFRSYSWMARADELYSERPEDPDEAFVFYWIAFNALYAEDSVEAREATERQNIESFFEKVLGLDEDELVNQALWRQFRNEIEAFLNNPFVYGPFWKYHNDVDGSQDWERRFERRNRNARDAITEFNTLDALTTLFDSLYVLRNQILHGAATYRSSVNRQQLQDGTKILASLLPIFFDIMQTNIHIDGWGKPYYPRVYIQSSQVD